MNIKISLSSIIHAYNAHLVALIAATPSHAIRAIFDTISCCTNALAVQKDVCYAYTEINVFSVIIKITCSKGDASNAPKIAIFAMKQIAWCAYPTII